MEPLMVIIVLVLVAVLAAIVVHWIYDAWPRGVRRLPFRGWPLARTSRLRQASLTRGVVNHLWAITSLNLPLAGALNAVGISERGRLGYVLRQMAALSAQGVPLSVALQKANPGCPPLASSVIAAGERAGQLPQALADLGRALDDQVRADTPTPQLGGRYWFYPFIVLGATAAVLTLLMVFIVPKLREICSDYDIALPGITLSLVDAIAWVAGGPGPVLAVGALALLLLATAVVSLANRGPRETAAHVILDTCAWLPGPTRTIAFAKGMSVTIRIVRMALAAGMTLPAAAELAASVRVNRYLRRRWEWFARLLRTGAPASDAARDAGLGHVFVWTCRNLERGAVGPAEALEHAADYHRAIARRWWLALARAAWPAITCVLGCIVGYVVLAFFLPLVALINSVAGNAP